MTTSSSTHTELWLSRFRPIAQPRLRLVCFAHAGGGPGAFRSWPDDLPGDVEVYGVRYPGRQDRLADAPIDRMEPLVTAIAEALEPLLDRPVALFGHSMGAWVAYEVALHLSEHRAVDVETLIVSGLVAPHRREPDPKRDDEELIREVIRLGGCDAELFEHPELRELVLPAIRADFELGRAYLPARRRQLNCPVLACSGTQDTEASDEGVQAWAELTTGRFVRRSFDGAHFYLVDEQTAVLRELSAWLSGTGG